MRQRGRRILVALIVAGAAFGIATAVQADIPDNGLIHGCYQFNAPNTSRGVLRVIDTSKRESCRFNELALNWNQRGITGATGPTGPVGATGPTGSRGPTGPGRVDSIVTKTWVLDTSDDALVVDCPADTVAEDAWWESTDPNAIFPHDSFNIGETTNGIPTNRWVTDVSISSHTTVVMYVSCVTPSSAFGF